jgi:hypothetical protein
VFSRARHQTLSWDKLIQSTPSNPISLRSTLILSPIYAFIFREVSFQASQPKFCTYLSSPHANYAFAPYHSPWFDDPNNILWRVQIMELLTVQLSSVSCQSSLLGPDTLLSNLFSDIFNMFSSLRCKHPVCYYIYYLVIYLTFNTRISISKIQVPLFMATCFVIKYNLQEIFKCLPTIRK